MHQNVKLPTVSSLANFFFNCNSRQDLTATQKRHKFTFSHQHNGIADEHHPRHLPSFLSATFFKHLLSKAALRRIFSPECDSWHWGTWSCRRLYVHDCVQSNTSASSCIFSSSVSPVNRTWSLTVITVGTTEEPTFLTPQGREQA